MGLKGRVLISEGVYVQSLRLSETVHLFRAVAFGIKWFGLVRLARELLFVRYQMAEKRNRYTIIYESWF